MPNRILILGAGRGQVGLIRTAKRLGYHVIVATLRQGDPPGVALADEVVEVDLTDSEAVFEVSRRLDLQGVVTACFDTPLQALGAVTEGLGLPGLSVSAAELCTDKRAMKRAFIRHGVSTARFAEVSDHADFERALERLSLPLVVKATDLQGSKGVYIARSAESAQVAFIQAMRDTARDYCIIEEFVEGKEFGAQALVLNGEVLFVMLHGDETVLRGTEVPIGHYVPYERASEALKIAVETEVRKAIAALGLDNCAVNVDLIDRDGEVVVIEITGRAGANCLPELTSIHFDFDYYELVARTAMQDRPLATWASRNTGARAGFARMLFSRDEGGELQSVSADASDERVAELTWFVQRSDEVRRFEDSNDCIGQIVVTGSSVSECKQLITTVEDSIDLKLSTREP